MISKTSRWNKPIPSNLNLNSPYEILCRDGIKLMALKRITGNNDSYSLNVFKLTGTVRVVDQYALIVATPNISNLTGVYSDLWDGTDNEFLTADGLNLSGAPVGTFFTKDKDASEEYSVNMSDRCRVNEIATDKMIGKPFIITQKNDTDTFIRFNYTTNTVLDFTMEIYFAYQLLNEGNLELVP